MRNSEITSQMINIMLQQMGATKINSSPSQVSNILFVINDEVKVKYEYGIDEDRIYLERIEPYPMLLGELTNENDVISMISADVHRFRRACNSSNFGRFLENVRSANNLRKEIENLFMLRNVEAGDMKKIAGALEEMHQIVLDTFKDSKALISLDDEDGAVGSDADSAAKEEK